MAQADAAFTEHPIAIVGGGIAGLTAALAFAERGLPVHVLERAPELREIGAGLQISPNATRILDRLGVIDALDGRYAAPEAVTILDAASLKQIAEVRLGTFGRERWGAPYLVAARGALQSALLSRVKHEKLITLTTGVDVKDFNVDNALPHLVFDENGTEQTLPTRLIVGADGVWSTIRDHGGPEGQTRAIGTVAWRATLGIGEGAAFRRIATDDRVTTFASPKFHAVAYPLGDGALNVVIITSGTLSRTGWVREGDPELLSRLIESAHPAIAELVSAVPNWTMWPLHIANPNCGWTHPNGLALIGDAAHAMAPFAAQGAAMAIEDADVLAGLVAENELTDALARYVALRRPRIRRVGLRGGLNQFAWHAKGPVALARNLFLGTRSPEKLAADLDWLYGWRTEADG
ncbi:FAD-dependent oxidoreductase [Aliihoeflea sp. PC F10.4]